MSEQFMQTCNMDERTNDEKIRDSKLKCPTCGHAVKYGHIVPVDRNDVLDEAILAVDNEKNQTCGSKSHAIKAIEVLKTDSSEQVKK